MVYCKCGLPPEYCEFGGKTNDTEDCKKWLAEQHLELHDTFYPPVQIDEESKEGEEVKKKKKKSVKSIEPKVKKIRVILLKRGVRKS